MYNYADEQNVGIRLYAENANNATFKKTMKSKLIKFKHFAFIYTKFVENLQPFTLSQENVDSKGGGLSAGWIKFEAFKPHQLSREV